MQIWSHNGRMRLDFTAGMKLRGRWTLTLSAPTTPVCVSAMRPLAAMTVAVVARRVVALFWVWEGAMQRWYHCVAA